MRKKLPTVLRVLAGLALAALMIPPFSLGVVNIFSALPGLCGLIVIFWPAEHRLLRRIFGRRWKRVVQLFLILAGVCVAAVAVELAFLLPAAARQMPPEGSAVVVPGCKAEGSEPSLLLWGRINAAGEYLAAHPGTFCIATGAQGADETRTEASVIRDKLVSRWHIDPARILLDEKSTNTLQNMRNAKAIMEENGLSANVAVATDGFHMFRSKLLARRCGLTPYALTAATDGRLRLMLYLRELLALPKSMLLDH